MNGVRTSKVGEIKLRSLVLSSVLKVGDTGELRPRSRALAVQRQVPVFWEEEGDLSRFSLFREPIPVPAPDREVRMYRRNVIPQIAVGRIDIISLSAAAILHVGSCVSLDSESRIKHFRQFVTNYGDAGLPRSPAVVGNRKSD